MMLTWTKPLVTIPPPLVQFVDRRAPESAGVVKHFDPDAFGQAARPLAISTR